MIKTSKLLLTVSIVFSILQASANANEFRDIVKCHVNGDKSGFAVLLVQKGKAVYRVALDLADHSRSNFVVGER